MAETRFERRNALIEKLGVGFPRTVASRSRPGARIRILCGLLILWSAFGAARGRAQEPAASPTSTDLLRGGDRSAREGKYAEALLAWKRAYERRFSGFREVPFRFPV